MYAWTMAHNYVSSFWTVEPSRRGAEHIASMHKLYNAKFHMSFIAIFLKVN